VLSSSFRSSKTSDFIFSVGIWFQREAADFSIQKILKARPQFVPS